MIYTDFDRELTRIEDSTYELMIGQKWSLAYIDEYLGNLNKDRLVLEAKTKGALRAKRSLQGIGK